jgi:hypothetical protein
MRCSTCSYLECALQSRHGEYVTACTETFRRVSSKHMAYGLVEMERARIELEAHRSVCLSAVAAAAIKHSLVPAA